MGLDPEDLRRTGLGWTAEIVEDEEVGGWALSMTHEDHDEPVLVVPWVMGRNKKDPKPLGEQDFRTQVKAAQDFLTRTRNQIRRAHQVSFRVVDHQGHRVRVVFDLVPDDFEPEGVLVAWSELGEELGRVSCDPDLKLTRELAQAWLAGGMGPVSAGSGDRW